MGRRIVVTGVFLGLLGGFVHGDSLKSSLTSIMNTKDEPSMVDLGSIKLDKKPEVKKSRSAKSVVATVNGTKVLKKDVDSFLTQRTQGKVKDFDTLSNDQRKRLINELSLPILALHAANKELSDTEKKRIYSQLWMEKEASRVKVSDEEVKEIYDQLKKQAEDANATQPIPPFETIKNSLKVQMIEKIILGKLMKDVKIKVY